MRRLVAALTTDQAPPTTGSFGGITPAATDVIDSFTVTTGSAVAQTVNVHAFGHGEGQTAHLSGGTPGDGPWYRGGTWADYNGYDHYYAEVYRSESDLTLLDVVHLGYATQTLHREYDFWFTLSLAFGNFVRLVVGPTDQNAGHNSTDNGGPYSTGEDLSAHGITEPTGAALWVLDVEEPAPVLAWGGEVYGTSELIYPIRHVSHADLVGPAVGTALRSAYVAGQQHGRLMFSYDDGGDWKDGTIVPRPPTTPNGNLATALAELALLQSQQRIPSGVTHLVALVGLMVASRGLATLHAKIVATAGADQDEGADFTMSAEPQWDIVQRQGGRDIEDRTGKTITTVEGGAGPPIVIACELELDEVDTGAGGVFAKIEVPVFGIDSVTGGYATIRILWAQVFWEVRP